MPIYEYRCGKCGVFEVTQRITEPSLKRCPTCKGKIERLISPTSFVLKGSGWYATDYAHAGSQSKSDSSASETKANDTKGNGATDSSSADSAKAPSDSATKTGESGSSAKTSDSKPSATSSGKSKASAAKSAD